MPNNGRHKGRAPRRRPVAHRISGGGHRPPGDGCLVLAVIGLAVPLGLLAAAAGAIGRILL